MLSSVSAAPAAKQHPTVVLLEMPDGGLGSGVVIAPDWLLTCAHCGQATIAGGLEVTNTYIAPGGSVDMALMHVPGLTAKWYPPIAGAAPALHDELHAYGWHLGTQLLMTDGHQGKDSDEMSCPIIHGCSGGAVVNSSGELVGVVAWVRYTHTARGFDGYALPHISGYTAMTDALRAWIIRTLDQ